MVWMGEMATAGAVTLEWWVEVAVEPERVKELQSVGVAVPVEGGIGGCKIVRTPVVPPRVRLEPVKLPVIEFELMPFQASVSIFR